MKNRFIPTLMFLLALSGCSESSTFDEPDAAVEDAWDAGADRNDGNDTDTTRRADVQAVAVTTDAGDYTFSVTVSSPDTGCDQYADWWEVVGVGGDLVYRRILTHSHTTEQPFTRDGGPVVAQPGDTLIVRAHMHELGYGGAAMRGTAADGFDAAPDITADFAADLETQEPLPESCLF